MTSPLPRVCSTPELHGHKPVPLTLTGAGEGNRTLVVSLENFCSTIELHPRSETMDISAMSTKTIAQHVFNNLLPQNLVEGEGFEPSKAEPSDLQSDPFDRSGTPPNVTVNYAGVALSCQTHLTQIEFTSPQHPEITGAGTKNRTRDLLITSQAHYQLCYTGNTQGRHYRMLAHARQIRFAFQAQKNPGDAGNHDELG